MYFSMLVVVTILLVVGWGLGIFDQEIVSPLSRSLSSPSDTSSYSVSNGESDAGIVFADFPRKLNESGVIDVKQYTLLSPLTEAERALFEKNSADIQIHIENNDQFTLMLLWGLGLAQENAYLGELTTMQQQEQLEKLASTGGWTISKGEATSHFSRHNILALSDNQQRRVANIAATIYRPCCNNHARFADCNHGMAMLGVLSLGASQGLSDDQLYTLAARFNRAWFLNQYAQIGQYIQATQNKTLADIDPKILVGKEFSSATGFTQNVVRPLAALQAPKKIQSEGSGCSL